MWLHRCLPGRALAVTPLSLLWLCTSATPAEFAGEIPITDAWATIAMDGLEFGGSIQPICCVGDVNGDGFDDLLLSEVSELPDVTGAFLFLGHAEGWQVNMPLASAEASLSFSSPSENPLDKRLPD